MRLGLEAGVELHNLSSVQTAAAPIIQHRSDLQDESRVADILRDLQPDALIHLAAAGVRAGGTSLRELIAVNVLGLQTLLEAAARLERAPQIVIAGSWFEYAAQSHPIREDDPLAPSTPYGVSKAAAHMLTYAYAEKLPITVLRLFNLYGSGEMPPRLAPTLIERARNHQPIDLTGGEQIRDFVYVEDAAAVFWAAIQNPPMVGQPRVLNVGTGQGTQLRTFVEMLAALLNERGLSPDLRFGTLPYRTGEAMHAVANTDALKETFNGMHKFRTLHAGLKQFVEETL